MKKTLIGLAAAAALFAQAAAANAFEIGVVAFQMSSETHARVANAVEAAAKEKGWDVTVLNSNGSLPTHAEQIENLVQRGVDGIILAMSKPVEFDAQMAAVKEAGIPLITVMSGASPHALLDVQVNEYAVGASAALYLLGQIDYQGPILTQRFESHVGTRIRGKMLDVVLSENTGVTIAGSHSMARTKSWRDDVRNGMNALILQNAGGFKGIWASFDGQAFIIDDLLKAQGMNKGDVVAGLHRRRQGDLPAHQGSRFHDDGDRRHPVREDGRGGRRCHAEDRRRRRRQGERHLRPLSLHGCRAGRRLQRRQVSRLESGQAGDPSRPLKFL